MGTGWSRWWAAAASVKPGWRWRWPRSARAEASCQTAFGWCGWTRWPTAMRWWPRWPAACGCRPRPRAAATPWRQRCARCACYWCWTTASTCWTPPRCWCRRCWRRRRACACWSHRKSRCGCRQSKCGGCSRWPAHRPARRRRPRTTAQSPCCCNGCAPSTPVLCWTPATGRRCVRCAPGWTACRWRWSWPPPACRCWAWRVCRRGCKSGWRCSPKARATPHRATARCAPHSTGATPCSPLTSAPCCAG